MTRDVVTCAPDDAITSLMERMTTGKFRHMPVVDGGQLVGIVSIGDIVKHRVERWSANPKRCATTSRPPSRLAGALRPELAACDSAAIVSSISSMLFSAACDAELDGVGGAMEVEPADRADFRRDQNVRGIAGHARARDPVLHDVERLDHDGRNAGPVAAAEHGAQQRMTAGQQVREAAASDGGCPAGASGLHRLHWSRDWR